MSAILATSNGYRDMADGTLRLTIDVEPRDAAAALSLFGKRGSPVALARITDEAAVAHDQAAQAEAQKAERKPLNLASRVALTCQEVSFFRFLRSRHAALWTTAEWAQEGALEDSKTAARAVREFCGVPSRSQIIEGTAAERNWNSLVTDYHDWQRRAA